MNTTTQGFRLSAATGLHKGDRAYQQDQIELLVHPRIQGCALGLVADGMGGKSGGRTAADQVVMTARQVFERFSPARDDPTAMLTSLVVESHLMNDVPVERLLIPDPRYTPGAVRAKKIDRDAPSV